MTRWVWQVIAVPTLLLAGGQEPAGFQISVSVDLVVLHPAVRDARDQFVTDLKQQEFAVFEDGVRQDIRLFRREDVPVTVGLVIDHSGSMNRKMPDVLAAARVFVRTSNDKDQMFIVNFNEKVSLGLADTVQFSNRMSELEAGIQRAPLAGQTALYDAVAVALKKLETGGPEKKVLVVISDGGDNASSIKLEELLHKTGQSSALVYAIGIFDAGETDRNPDALKKLARGSGGDAFFPDQPEEVVSICGRIAHEIRNQYTLGYFSNNTARPGGWRGIRVTARHAGGKRLVARTRSGYMAGSK